MARPKVKFHSNAGRDPENNSGDAASKNPISETSSGANLETLSDIVKKSNQMAKKNLAESQSSTTSQSINGDGFKPNVYLEQDTNVPLTLNQLIDESQTDQQPESAPIVPAIDDLATEVENVEVDTRPIVKIPAAEENSPYKTSNSESMAKAANDPSISGEDLSSFNQDNKANKKAKKQATRSQQLAEDSNSNDGLQKSYSFWWYLLIGVLAALLIAGVIYLISMFGPSSDSSDRSSDASSKSTISTRKSSSQSSSSDAEIDDQDAENQNPENQDSYTPSASSQPTTPDPVVPDEVPTDDGAGLEPEYPVDEVPAVEEP